MSPEQLEVFLSVIKYNSMLFHQFIHFTFRQYNFKTFLLRVPSQCIVCLIQCGRCYSVHTLIYGQYVSRWLEIISNIFCIVHADTVYLCTFIQLYRCGGAPGLYLCSLQMVKSICGGLQYYVKSETQTLLKTVIWVFQVERVAVLTKGF